MKRPRMTGTETRMSFVCMNVREMGCYISVIILYLYMTLLQRHVVHLQRRGGGHYPDLVHIY